MKSPKETRMSPRKRILDMFPRISSKISLEDTRMTEPSEVRTTGGSIESTGVTVPPFPGYSVLSCVPVTR